ncbi:tetratricopeptide repeat protein [Sphingomonas lutea]|uniref:Tetratricopeptide repeat protein n=1 Tax=Sphingomonas lutea TaxID=1045317 RepID=A0A7G9SGJ4_9SPHN|nr:tetratricopeptide repeat protein [Sphingomonas lutea]QNN66969.1 tetratricopeptide repeat protein [Sphingomonas lutea]
MTATVRPFAFLFAAGALMSVSPAEEPQFSKSYLAMLDPTGPVMNLCGGKNGGMRAKLMLSAAVVQGAALPATEPLLDGLGKVDFAITTGNPLARRYFNQGLSFAYGFNHAAAIAAFREAQRLDPDCAMCFWGEALAHGPNINAPMDAAVNARAVGLARYANWLARKGTPAEKAATAAMLTRYAPDANADRAALDAAYADAMLAAAKAHPTHDDLALLAAEAAMDTKPWDYWTPDKQPQPRIGEAIQLVETVYTRNPDHPQAAHLYIHLMENGPDPKRAEAAADKLAAPLAPTAGHLVHMPAHIYYRLGRWKDSMRVNVDAARADETWIKASGDRGLVRYGYYPHNVHFIVTSAQMAGDIPTALRESRKLAGILDPKVSSQIGWIQAVNAAPYFAALQIASPAQVLALRAPDPRLPYANAMRHYARASAYAQQRNRGGFERELGRLRAIRASGDFKGMVDQGVPATDLLQLAETVARARWAYAGRNYAEAARLYREAISVEGKISYMEPPWWYYPVHQSLGAALYRAGKYAEAQEAFTAALARSPNNGWALYGLAASERALGHRDRAAAANLALRKAWLGNPNWLTMDRL